VTAWPTEAGFADEESDVVVLAVVGRVVVVVDLVVVLVVDVAFRFSSSMDHQWEVVEAVSTTLM
jgi:hypothetical protein